MKKLKLDELSLQEYLSLGYIYLVILGIISDVIYFRFLDIDILNYASILDIFHNTNKYLSHDLRSLLIFVFFIAGAYYFVTRAAPKFHFKFRDKQWYKKIHNVEKLDKAYARDRDNSGGIILVMLFVLSMFLGYGIGSGSDIKKEIKNGDTKTDHIIHFSDGQDKRVDIIGQNTMFLFM